MKLISIITVTLNCGVEIKKTVESVERQKRPEIEYLIIDGKSNDGTLEYLQGKLGVVDKIHSELDCGIYDAMNKGVVYSSGNYKWFLNAGDVLCPGALDSVIPSLAANKNIEILSGKMIFVRGENEWPIDAYRPNTLGKLREMNVIPHPSTLVSEKIFDRFGLFDSTLNIVGDYDFFLRVLRKELRLNLMVVDAPLVIMGSGGVSDPYSQKFRIFQVLKEIFVIHNRHFGFLHALVRFGFNFLYFLRCKCRRRFLRSLPLS